MSVALERFCCIFQSNIQSQVELPTYIDVDSCRCTISYNVVLNIMASLILINRAAHSVLEADAITFLLI